MEEGGRGVLESRMSSKNDRMSLILRMVDQRLRDWRKGRGSTDATSAETWTRDSMREAEGRKPENTAGAGGGWGSIETAKWVWWVGLGLHRTKPLVLVL